MSNSNMPVCNNLEDLYESALLLIGNAGKFADWANGDENTNVTLGGKSVPSLRKLIANINRVAGIATLQNIGGVRPDGVTINIDELGVIWVVTQALIQAGGGINVDANKKLYVDFSQMPTDKFETLLKSLRIPIWLTANTDFYVDKNHANASDNLVEGRGLSANLPFKTLQACINNIQNNYNIGPYTCRILISNDVYNEFLTLGDYSRTTGSIQIVPAQNNGYVQLHWDESKMRSLLAGVSCRGGNWSFSRLKAVGNYNFNNVECFNWGLKNWVFEAVGGKLTLIAPDVDITFSGNNYQGTGIIENVIFGASDGGVLTIQPQVDETTKFYLTDNLTLASGSLSKILFYAYGANSSILLTNRTNLSASDRIIHFKGSYTKTAVANGGTISRNSVYTSFSNFQIDSGTSTGKRYEATSGGKIDTLNGGPEWFPGDTAGTVQSSTYAWYA